MENSPISMTLTILLPLLLLLPTSNSQQPYQNNDMLQCYDKNGSSILGYNCTGPSTTCDTYLIFRSQTNYQSPSEIAYFLNSSASDIATVNGVNDVFVFPVDQLVLVPVTCSCYTSRRGGPSYYQHDAYYTLKYETETYLHIANNTYQGLSSCQAMMQQNPDDDSRNLTINLRLKVPLRCACPSRNQTTAGYKFLLSYLVTWDDAISAIAERFGTDANVVRDANQLEVGQMIFPFTTILVPLKTRPTKDMVGGASAVAPSAPPQPPPAAPPGGGGSDKKWVIFGVVIAVCFVGLCGLLVFLLCFIHRRRRESPPVMKPANDSVSTAEYNALSGKDSQSSGTMLSAEARALVGPLAAYKYDELLKATGGFDEANRIGGSVYRGTINGDTAAVKRIKGDASSEIKILQKINHTNLVRLSGFCIHHGHTYLVYEFAGNGSLADRLHGDGNVKDGNLSWKQRAQIAYDVADGLNYLHNHTTPSCVHKDLKSSNILLDGELRVKLINFGLARAVAEDGATPLQTRHVVGTQGYMPPEYLEHGLLTAKIDVFAFGVVLLELLSGKEAILSEEGQKRGVLLSSTIDEVVTGEDVSDKLKNFLDPSLIDNCPMDSVFAMAQLARRCVAQDPAIRPTMEEVYVGLSAIHSSALDWDPSSERSLP